MKFRFCFLAFVALGLMVGVSIFTVGAQTENKVVDDPDGKFTLTIQEAPKPGDGWHAVLIENGVGRKQLEIIYKVREDGLLKVRRMDVEKGTKLTDIFKRDEGQALTFLPGYTKGPLEEFSVGGGKIPAVVTAYDFTQGGRPKKGRNYYLLVNETTVYVLRYTGNRGTMEALRNQTDAIARSFKVK